MYQHTSAASGVNDGEQYMGRHSQIGEGSPNLARGLEVSFLQECVRRQINLSADLSCSDGESSRTATLQDLWAAGEGHATHTSTPRASLRGQVRVSVTT